MSPVPLPPHTFTDALAGSSTLVSATVLVLGSAALAAEAGTASKAVTASAQARRRRSILWRFHRRPPAKGQDYGTGLDGATASAHLARGGHIQAPCAFLWSRGRRFPSPRGRWRPSP